jgi:hypothetical protein
MSPCGFVIYCFGVLHQTNYLQNVYKFLQGAVINYLSNSFKSH